MQGMDRRTGRKLSGIAHLRQSVEDILTTRIGSRVMRRSYGSELPNLIDEPYNANTRMDMIAATADALARWETRFNVTSVDLTHTYQNGKAKVEIDVAGDYLPDGTSIKLEGIVIS
ncbi:GPW/gp25 family protein [Vibrio fluvialis]|nr:GPW/gp25 family protein [Vibrio phage VD1]MBY7994815.1 GPW/gp25 family protein [Vibrio fluvialis]